VISGWLQYAEAGATALVWVIVEKIKEHPLSWRILAYAAIAFLLFAFFNIWRSEAKSHRDTRGTLDRLERAAQVSGVKAADWKELSVRFKQLSGNRSRADWTRTSCEGVEVDAQWRLVGGADGCEQLCTLAGAMLLKSPNIRADLPDDIKSQPNDVWRWLYFIKDKRWLIKRVMHGEGVDDATHHITLMESIEMLAHNSARACVECEAREI
jgi:hypothetical protein